VSTKSQEAARRWADGSNALQAGITVSAMLEDLVTLAAVVLDQDEESAGDKPTMGEFWECESCRGKSGSPLLCGACLHNRNLISQLQPDPKQAVLDDRARQIAHLKEQIVEAQLQAARLRTLGFYVDQDGCQVMPPQNDVRVTADKFAMDAGGRAIDLLRTLTMTDEEHRRRPA
jgi:hypothetical protein